MFLIELYQFFEWWGAVLPPIHWRIVLYMWTWTFWICRIYFLINCKSFSCNQRNSFGYYLLDNPKPFLILLNCLHFLLEAIYFTIFILFSQQQVWQLGNNDYHGPKILEWFHTGTFPVSWWVFNHITLAMAVGESLNQCDIGVQCFAFCQAGLLSI